MPRQATGDLQAELDKAAADGAAKRLTEDEEERQAESRDRDKANAKHAHKEAYPNATEAVFESSCAALIKQRADWPSSASRASFEPTQRSESAGASSPHPIDN